MVLTPGKVGELLKSYLVKQVAGTPMARTAPIVLAERLTDGIALLLLGAAGLLLYRRGWQVLAAIFVLAVVLVLVIQSRPLCERLLDTLERLPVGRRIAPPLRAAYASSARLLRLDALLPAIGLGFLSWSGECLAFYVILRGLHLGGDGLVNLPLLVQAAFILASSTLGLGGVGAGRARRCRRRHYRPGSGAAPGPARRRGGGDAADPLLHALVRRLARRARPGALQSAVWSADLAHGGAGAGTGGGFTSQARPTGFARRRAAGWRGV